MSVAPTSRTGLPSILAPTWDDPHAGKASNGRRALFRVPPPAPAKLKVRAYLCSRREQVSAILLPRRWTQQRARFVFELLGEAVDLSLGDVCSSRGSGYHDDGIYHHCSTEDLVRNLGQNIWPDDAKG
jgi:hypothetical protein